MNEIWKDIPGYEGYYQVSNLGRIKGIKRKRWNGRYYQFVKEKIIKLNITKDYANVCLSKSNNKKTLLVHRLVCLAFLPNVNSKREVNHINGIKHDNRLENLEWCTPLENYNHAVKTGLHIPSKVNKKVLMSSIDNDPLLIFDSLTEASKELMICLSSISRCCHYKQNYAGGYKWKFMK